MNVPLANGDQVLLFYCARQDPANFTGVGNGVCEIEVPCSGRVGIGELMQGFAAGYEKVIVLSCGEKSCVYSFGCSEAKRAMERVRKLAEIAGIDGDRFIFIEADDSEIDKL